MALPRAIPTCLWPHYVDPAIFSASPQYVRVAESADHAQLKRRICAAVLKAGWRAVYEFWGDVVALHADGRLAVLEAERTAERTGMQSRQRKNEARGLPTLWVVHERVPTTREFPDLPVLRATPNLADDIAAWLAGIPQKPEDPLPTSQELASLGVPQWWHRRWRRMMELHECVRHFDDLPADVQRRLVLGCRQALTRPRYRRDVISALCLASHDSLARMGFSLAGSKEANCALVAAAPKTAAQKAAETTETQQKTIETLVVALRKAHACATLRPDGTCDGCFVSEALQVAKT